MPVYGTRSIPTALYPGDTGLSINAEAPGSSMKGERMALSLTGGLGVLSLEAQWSAAPSAAVIDLQVANTDADADYVTVDSLTFTGTQAVLRDDIAGLGARFARAVVISHTGSETLTCRIVVR